MMRAIVLDSSPLGLLVHRPDYPPTAECREWLRQKLSAGIAVHVPAIVVYELRRELYRLDSRASMLRLQAFIQAEPGRCLPLSDDNLEKAAELWARIRMQGKPTADRFALDIHVILAAQALSLKLPPEDFVVATENVGHLSLLVRAESWRQV